MLVRNHRVASLPIGAASEPRVNASRLEHVLVLEQLNEKGFCVGANRLLQIRVQLTQFGGVNVYRDLVGLASEVLRSVAGNGEVEPHADREQEVAILQRKVRPASRHRS